jgi:hypothetical protein
VRATPEAHSEYDVVYDERPRIRVFALDLYRPLLRFGVLRSPRDLGGSPDIQFQAVCITLEPIRKLHTCRQRVCVGGKQRRLLLGRAQRLATLVGSCMVPKVEQSSTEQDGSAHGRYGMWSYPDAASQKKGPIGQRNLFGRTHGVV